LSAGPASTSSVGPASGSRLSDGELVVDRIEAFDDLAEVPASDVVLVAVKATLPNSSAAVPTPSAIPSRMATWMAC